MKTIYKILFIAIPIVLIVSSGYLNASLNFVVDSNTSDGMPYNLEIIFHEEEYAVEYFVIDGSTDNIEIAIPFDIIDGVFMVHVNGENVDDERVAIDDDKIIVNYGQNIESVKLIGLHDLDAEENKNVLQAVESNTVPIEHLCAFIGFEKYPDNLFAEFLENPHNKDVTFLNFTDSDLKQIPEFYELVLEANQLDYPLNDRVRFAVSPEEHNVIKDHLEKREYSEFNKNGETVLHQSEEEGSAGSYRTPRILMDGKLYSINGLNSQVFSDRAVNMNIQYSGTLEEVKQRLVENTNPNAANLVYVEINKDENVPFAPLIEAINQIHKSKDKIRMSEDVGGLVQDKVEDFFAEQNNVQFNGDKTKHTRYFILNEILYETSFVIC